MAKGVAMRVFLGVLASFFMGCASAEKYPSGANVRVGKERPHGDCEEIDQVIGTTAQTGGSYDKAMEDLKREAAYKNGNYVRILAVSAHGTAIRGIAYQCR